MARYETADAVYFRRLRNARIKDHYAGAYKGNLRRRMKQDGALLPRGILPGSEAARTFLSGRW